VITPLLNDRKDAAMTESTMTSPAPTVEQLQALVAELTARLEALEARVERNHPSHLVDDEVLLAISAACAAFLGKRARVKQVHLRRHTTWSKQGRSDVQHSHAIRTR
jgi:methylmalonyl-CoA carboxyltransferase 12S subunit